MRRCLRYRERVVIATEVTLGRGFLIIAIFHFYYDYDSSNLKIFCSGHAPFELPWGA